MEQLVLMLSIRTHVFASRVTLEHIVRQVRVWDFQTSVNIQYVCWYSIMYRTFSKESERRANNTSSRKSCESVERSVMKHVYLNVFISTGWLYYELLRILKLTLTNAVAARVWMEQLVLRMSIRTHVFASRVTLEHIVRQVRVWVFQTSVNIQYVCWYSIMYRTFSKESERRANHTSSRKSCKRAARRIERHEPCVSQCSH